MAIDTGRHSGAGGTPSGRRAADDPHYNLVSVLYHAMKGSDLYEEYVADAEAAGDIELRDFFTEAQQEETRRAQRARELLRTRLEHEAGAGQTDTEKAAE